MLPRSAAVVRRFCSDDRQLGGEGTTFGGWGAEGGSKRGEQGQIVWCMDYSIRPYIPDIALHTLDATGVTTRPWELCDLVEVLKDWEGTQNQLEVSRTARGSSFKGSSPSGRNMSFNWSRGIVVVTVQHIGSATVGADCSGTNSSLKTASTFVSSAPRSLQRQFRIAFHSCGKTSPGRGPSSQ